jgi:hypothetical protein
MKPTRIVAACIAAVAVTLTLFAPLSYGASSTTPELAVLTEQGISLARAHEALRLQQQVAEMHLGQRIEEVLGDDFAGVWFEPAAARFHIGVTGIPSRNAAERVVEQAHMTAYATYTPVRSTWSALIGAQDQWNTRITKLLTAGQAATGIDVQHNAVSVTLSSSVSPSTSRALVSEAAAASVHVSISFTSSTRLGLKLEATCEIRLLAGERAVKEHSCRASDGRVAMNPKEFVT